jgi:hypothetical protein
MWGRLDAADIVISYIEQSYIRSAKITDDTMLEEWKRLVSEVRVERFIEIISDEMPYVDERLDAELDLLLKQTGSSPEERMEVLRHFFAEKYKVGQETWRSLPLTVTIHSALDALVNALQALGANSKQSVMLRIGFRMAEGVVRLARVMARVLLPRRKT